MVYGITNGFSNISEQVRGNGKKRFLLPHVVPTQKLPKKSCDNLEWYAGKKIESERRKEAREQRYKGRLVRYQHTR